MAHRHLQVGLAHLLHEEVTVLGVHDSLHTGAQHLHAILLQDALLEQLGAAVQGCLTAECQQDAVGTLLLDDFGHKKGIDGQEINLIRNTFTRLNSCHVRIDEHRADALFPKSLQSLTTRIVELTCLSNLQGTRTQDKHLLQLFLHAKMNLIYI